MEGEPCPKLGLPGSPQRYTVRFSRRRRCELKRETNRSLGVQELLAVRTDPPFACRRVSVLRHTRRLPRRRARTREPKRGTSSSPHKGGYSLHSFGLSFK